MKKSLKQSTAASTCFFSMRQLAKNRKVAKIKFNSHLYTKVTRNLLMRLAPLKKKLRSVCDLSPSHTPGISTPLKRLKPDTDLIVRAYSVPPLGMQFDLIISPLQLHWTNDPRAYLERLWHSLRPGGLMLCAFWGGHTLSAFRHALAESDFAHYQHVFPRVHPTIPLKQAAQLISDTPFVLTVIDQDYFVQHYENLVHATQNLRQMAETAAPFMASTPHTHISKPFLKPSAIQHIEKHTRLYHKQSKNNIPGITQTLCNAFDSSYQHYFPLLFHQIVLTGWRDGPGIPKPCTKGSGKQSLDSILS